MSFPHFTLNDNFVVINSLIDYFCSSFQKLYFHIYILNKFTALDKTSYSEFLIY